ncbi:MAG: DUF1611 domain-containing protein [Pseudomonadota bacterium]
MHPLEVSSNILPTDTKWAFTTRRVCRTDVAGLSGAFAQAVPGDLVLGTIIEIGQHKKLQLAQGRYSESHVGDHVVLVVGDRYAPDQFEGISHLNDQNCDLIAGGGIIGKAIHAHGQMSKPTQIKPTGLLTNAEGEVVNIASYSLSERAIPDDVTVIGVFGTSMNSGKTTAAASLAHGLKRAGYRVHGVKATGTGAFGDYNAFQDAGVPVLDFTDAGMGTTYKMPLDRIENGFETLVGTAAAQGAEIVVVEFADGVFQSEAHEILSDSKIRSRLDGLVFASSDAAGAVGGISRMRALGLDALAVSGLVSRSPLGTLEAQNALGLPVLTRKQLQTPDAVMAAIKPALRHQIPELVQAA